MNRIFPAVNLVLVLTIGFLITMSVRVWTHPPYPSRVDSTSLNVAPKKFENLAIEKPEFNEESVSQVVQNNLFRKERREYVPPPPPPSPPPDPVIREPALPLPELDLKGILILGNTRVAILEWYAFHHAEWEYHRKKVKKKGYSLGDLVGEFELAKIEKTSVTLADPKGREVTVRLITNAPGKLDLRKNPSKNSKNTPRRDQLIRFKPARPPFQVSKAKPQNVPDLEPSPTPVFRVSGAPTPAH